MCAGLVRVGGSGLAPGVALLVRGCVRLIDACLFCLLRSKTLVRHVRGITLMCGVATVIVRAVGGSVCRSVICCLFVALRPRREACRRARRVGPGGTSAL